MISPYLSSMEPALLNHMWQSTAFAVVIAVLTLLFRKNHARVRYALWVAASVKFLLPFSLLIGLSALLPKSVVTVTAPRAVFRALDTAALPFPNFTVGPSAVSTPHSVSFAERTKGWLPASLMMIWAFGAVVVLGMWLLRWRRVQTILSLATIAYDTSAQVSRVVGNLRRIETTLGLPGSIPVMLSADLMEPGIVGIFRPRLLWPEQLSERLQDEHIAAILAHELMHVRRYDNLTAILHLGVEAAFWFHPMVWWMERRMVEERERACDEAVVAMGTQPKTYVEGLLKTARFCVESPLTCVAGITSADLSRRVRSIMTLQQEQLSLSKKVMLTVLAVAAIAGPVVFGQMRSAVPAASQPITTNVAAGPVVGSISQPTRELPAATRVVPAKPAALLAAAAPQATQPAAAPNPQGSGGDNNPQITVAEAERQLQFGKALLAVAQGAVDQTQIDVDKYKALMQRGIVSIQFYRAEEEKLRENKAELENAKAQMLVQQKAIREAQARIAAAQPRAAQ